MYIIIIILLLQKRAMRAVCYTKYNAHIEPLFKMCNVLKFNDLYDTKLLIFYHQLLNNNTSSNFLNFKPTISKANEIYIIRNLFSYIIYFLHITMTILNYLSDTSYPHYWTNTMQLAMMMLKITWIITQVQTLLNSCYQVLKTIKNIN